MSAADGPPRAYETRMTSAQACFWDRSSWTAHLGGGLLPGTLTVVAGATGVGKTQLGLHWANAGLGARRTTRRPLRPDQSR